MTDGGKKITSNAQKLTKKRRTNPHKKQKDTKQVEEARQTTNVAKPEKTNVGRARKPTKWRKEKNKEPTNVGKTK